MFESCSFNPISAIHDYETPSWVAESSKYVEEGRSYQDLILPQAVTEEQGKLLQLYYVGSVTKDNIITTLDETFAKANKLND